MEWRIEQPDRDRHAPHDREQFPEIGPLHRQKPVEGGAALLLAPGEDHLLHDRNARGLEEHVLRPAEPEAVRAEPLRRLGLAGRVGVGAHRHVALGIGPVQQAGERAAHLGRHRRGAADRRTSPRVPSSVKMSPATRTRPSGAVRLRRAASRRRSPAPTMQGGTDPARDDRRMAAHAATQRQDAAGRMHSPDVLGAGLRAREDDRLALRRRALGLQGREDETSRRGAGARREAGAEHVARGAGIDLRMQMLDQPARLHAQKRLAPVDHAAFRQVDRDPDGGAGVAPGGRRVDHADPVVALRTKRSRNASPRPTDAVSTARRSAARMSSGRSESALRPPSA